MSQDETNQQAKPESAKRKRGLSKWSLLRIPVAVLLVIAISVGIAYIMFVHMPGKSWSKPLPEATEAQLKLAEALRSDVEYLCNEIGARNVYQKEAYEKSVEYIEGRFKDMGYDVNRKQKLETLRETHGRHLQAERPVSIRRRSPSGVSSRCWVFGSLVVLATGL